MSDLISRKAVVDILQQKADENSGLLRNNMLFAKKIIESVPTAYDVDKVVEQLDDYLFEKHCIEGDGELEKIIKGGGVNE